jgi:hypothetical protein
MTEEENQPRDEMIVIPKEEYEKLLEVWNKEQERKQSKKEYDKIRAERYRETHNHSSSNDWQKLNREKVTERRREYNRLRYLQKKEESKLITHPPRLTSG